MTRTEPANEADVALRTMAARTRMVQTGGADLNTKEGQAVLASSMNKVLDPAYVSAPVEFLNKDGFMSQMARDVFSLAGNKDDAVRADAMCELLGEALAEALRTRALSAGFNNECDWLAQQLQVAFEREEFSTVGAEDPRTEADDEVNSHYNQLIEKMLGKRNLGRIVQHAKMAKPELSNPETLRWGVHNLILILRKRGI
jgi:hypothetical protein